MLLHLVAMCVKSLNSDKLCLVGLGKGPAISMEKSSDLTVSQWGCSCTILALVACLLKREVEENAFVIQLLPCLLRSKKKVMEKVCKYSRLENSSPHSVLLRLLHDCWCYPRIEDIGLLRSWWGIIWKVIIRYMVFFFGLLQHRGNFQSYHLFMSSRFME